MRRKLLQIDVARGLGISASMVSRLKRRGMPTHSIEAASAWRRAHLDLVGSAEQATRRGRILHAAPTTNHAPRNGGADDTAEALERIEFLRELAAADFATYGERLRRAMAALPKAHWDAVALPVALWEKLGEPYFAILDAECGAAGEPSSPASGDFESVCDVVYGLAAGLYRIEPASD